MEIDFAKFVGTVIMIIMILSMQSYAESTLCSWAIGHSLRILQFIEVIINQNFVVIK